MSLPALRIALEMPMPFLHQHQSVSTGHKNVEIRTAQYRTSFDAQACLRLAKGLVSAKIQNQKTLLRRNWKQGSVPEGLMDGFQALANPESVPRRVVNHDRIKGIARPIRRAVK